jgi:transcriptional regulator with XRE-family HTH domain
MGQRVTKRADEADRMVGSNIRTFREIKGLTQAQLGDKIGVTFQQLQKYEKAQNRVSASMLYRIARSLDVPVGEFFNMPKKSEDDFSLLTDDELLLLRTYRKMIQHKTRNAKS